MIFFIDLYDHALKHYLTSLDIKAASLSPQHPSIASTLENLGRIFELKKDFSQALSYFQKANTIYRQIFSATHDKVIQIEEHIRHISHQMK